MPGMDGTGPYGTGPFGRGLGPCGGGLAGRGRGRGFGRGWGFSPTPAGTPLDEKTILEQEKNWLEARLKTILQRLQGLE